MTATFTPLWMLPVVLPVLAAVLVLLIDAVAPALFRLHAPLVAALTLVAAITASAGALPGAAVRRALCTPDGSCLYVAGPSASLLQTMLLAVLAVVVAATIPIPSPRQWAAPRAALLATIAALGAAVVAATDLVMLVIGSAGLMLLTPALIASRSGAQPRAAAVRHARWALPATGLLVLGAGLIMAGTGAARLCGGTCPPETVQDGRRAALVLGIVLVVIALSGLAALLPVSTWLPSVISAASLPTAAVVGVVAPVVAAGALLVIRPTVFAAGSSGAAWVFGLLGAVGLVGGALLAVRERQLPQLLAWWIAAQAGWLVLPLAAEGERGARASVAHAVVLGAALCTAVVALTLVAHADGRQRVRTVADLRGLVRRHPLAGWALVAAVATLVALPPAMGGAAARYAVIEALAAGDLWWLAAAGLLGWLTMVLGGVRFLAVVLATPVVEPRADVPEVALRSDRPARLHQALTAVALVVLIALNLAPNLVFGPLGR